MFLVRGLAACGFNGLGGRVEGSVHFLECRVQLSGSRIQGVGPTVSFRIWIQDVRFGCGGRISPLCEEVFESGDTTPCRMTKVTSHSHVRYISL